jgi:hypothetical protein
VLLQLPAYTVRVIRICRKVKEKLSLRLNTHHEFLWDQHWQYMCLYSFRLHSERTKDEFSGVVVRPVTIKVEHMKCFKTKRQVTHT